jgi:hypothetical protein
LSEKGGVVMVKEKIEQAETKKIELEVVTLEQIEVTDTMRADAVF